MAMMASHQEPTSPPPSSQQQPSRGVVRRAHLGAVFLSTFTAATAAAVANDGTTTTKKKPRLKGAAEIDAEAYLQDLLRGNPLTGGLDQSPIKVRPARTIDLKFATFLDKATQEQISKASGLAVTEVVKEVSAFRKAVEPGFQRRAPFPSNELSNERCFDCYTYADFRVASKLIPNLRARAFFMQGLGEAVLNEIISEAREGGNIINPVNASRDGLEGVIDGLGRILAFMQAKGFLKAFRINSEDYDRASWDEGYNIELQVTLVEPATLGGNVLFTSEGFLFHPDYVDCTLLAYLRRCGVTNAKALQYLLDTEYRPNPKDYDPTEILYQISLEKKA